MHLYWALSRAKLVIIFIAVLAFLLTENPVAHAATSITAYPVPTASSQPNTLILGPDGNFWFPEVTGDKIGKITPTGIITEYPLTPGSKPAQMAIGPDGNVWFTEIDSNKIGRITLSGIITEYDIPTPAAEPAWISAGPDGNIWFTKRSGGVGKIAMDGTITEYQTPNGMPGRITAGPDGNVWFTNNGYFISGPDTIVKITPSGTTTEYVIGSGVSPTSIIAGPDDNIWFTETDADKIGKLTPSGVLTEYDVPSDTASYPYGLRIGPDDIMWFSEFGSHEIGTITTSGIITEYHVDIDTMNNPFPEEFVLMPGNVLWYASAPFNQITVLRDWGPTDSVTTPTPTPVSNPSTTSSSPPSPTVVTGASSAKQPSVSQKLYDDNFYTSPVVSPTKLSILPAVPSSSESDSPSTPNIKTQDAQHLTNNFRPSKLIGVLLALVAVGLLFLLLRHQRRT
ncbi:MAG: lyase-like protein [Candidatus Saccharibacteria bacterium]|nr:lyase-like protein [Candidatus Saccharibacteria bacterium]